MNPLCLIELITGVGLADGLHLLRAKTAEALAGDPHDCILTVMYKKKPTHHAVVRDASKGHYTVNGKPCPDTADLDQVRCWGGGLREKTEGLLQSALAAAVFEREAQLLARATDGDCAACDCLRRGASIASISPCAATRSCGAADASTRKGRGKRSEGGWSSCCCHRRAGDASQPQRRRPPARHYPQAG